MYNGCSFQENRSKWGRFMQDLGRFSPPSSWQFGEMTNADGKKVRYGHAKPEGESKGKIVMTTGYADFIESYYETMHDYLDRGYEVYMMDWFGQGGSERYDTERPWIPNPHGFKDNVRDLKQFMTEVVKPKKDEPVFHSTHSMGGHVAMHYMHKYPNDFDGAMLGAPFINVHLKPWKKKAAKILAATMTAFGRGDARATGRERVVKRIKELREESLKEEPMRKRVHRIFADENPNLKLGDPTYHWLKNSFNAAAKLNKKSYLNKIKTNVLIIGAEKDGMVNNDYAKRAASHMPAGRYYDLKEAYHDVWTERERIRKVMWAEIDGFMADQIKKKQGLAHKKPTPKTPKR